MKFSVLLPTRNRLELLRFAIETVRLQDYDDWEIIVSDNASEEDIQGYIQSLKEPRIKYFRTPEFVPVSDNWNNALAHSLGEYIVTLGDDDALMPHYFRTLASLIVEYGQPDVIHTGAYLYAYPGVYPKYPSGFLQNFCNPLFKSEQPVWLKRDDAQKLVEFSVQLKMRFPTNIQFSAVSRRLVEEMADKGPFFQSPYPDFYATNAIFLAAKNILVYQKPLVIIGVSPKSFGFYHNNRNAQNEAAGADFLQTHAFASQFAYLAKVLLPWCNYNTCWLLAMETLKNNFKEVPLQVGYRRYRFLQSLNLVKNRHYDQRVNADEYRSARRHLTYAERILYVLPFSMVFKSMHVLQFMSLFPKVERLRKYFGHYTIDHPQIVTENCRNVLDVFKAGYLHSGA